MASADGRDVNLGSWVAPNAAPSSDSINHVKERGKTLHPTASSGGSKREISPYSSRTTTSVADIHLGGSGSSGRGLASIRKHQLEAGGALPSLKDMKEGFSI